MDVKDLFYIVGICSTLLLSVPTFYLNIKNRRNALREHLYKEQISFFKDLFFELNRLNAEFDKIINSSVKGEESHYRNIIASIASVFQKNEFMMPSEIAKLSKNLIVNSQEFFSIQLNSDNAKKQFAYKKYYDEYYSLLKYIKDFYGIDNLSQENKKLHKDSNLSEASENRKLKEVFTNMDKRYI